MEEIKQVLVKVEKENIDTGEFVVPYLGQACFDTERVTVETGIEVKEFWVPQLFKKDLVEKGHNTYVTYYENDEVKVYEVVDFYVSGNYTVLITKESE